LDMHQLELLEDRIRKAAELIGTLREERAALERRLADREGEIEEMRARAAEGSGEDGGRELEKLRSERREILARVNRMLGILDEAAALSGEEDLLAAVDETE
jgi:chromosome segregation ATPase